jgi:hypothetical protein
MVRTGLDVLDFFMAFPPGQQRARQVSANRGEIPIGGNPYQDVGKTDRAL